MTTTRKVRFFRHFDAHRHHPIVEEWPVWTFTTAQEALATLLRERDAGVAWSAHVSYVDAQTGAPETIGVDLGEDADLEVAVAMIMDASRAWDLHFEWGPVEAEMADLDDHPGSHPAG